MKGLAVMNVFIIVSAIITAAAVVAPIWFGYRLYKRLGRRCTAKSCGCMLKRVSKILLPPDEFVSGRSSIGRRRWWIRRVVKLTFIKCEKHGVKLVKIDTDPISLWHAYWVQWFHKEQYYLADQDLVEATRQKLRELYLGGRCENLNPEATDTPPISLGTLFIGFFEEIDDIIGGN
jgi:hypothetical protein